MAKHEENRQNMRLYRKIQVSLRCLSLAESPEGARDEGWTYITVKAFLCALVLTL